MTQGLDAVSLRAIAREMGMTAPGLYRYFSSHEDLVRHVIADIFTEIADDLHTAIHRAGVASGGDMTAKLVAACREFRAWSLARLYGMVSLEVFGHLRFALDDASAMFELTLSELAALAGLEYPAAPA